MDKGVAAEKFAELIKKLAIDGNIDSLSIKIKSCGSDELFQLAHAIGISELSVTAFFGS